MQLILTSTNPLHSNVSFCLAPNYYTQVLSYCQILGFITGDSVIRDEQAFSFKKIESPIYSGGFGVNFGLFLFLFKEEV